MSMSADYWISKFSMEKHPEGGWFRETYRSGMSLESTALPAVYGGERNISTAIYFLLEGNDISKLHRLRSDEIWFFHCGSPLVIHCIDSRGNNSSLNLGMESFQGIIPAGTWFGAEVCDKDSFSLVSCTVSPGFDFADFELGDRSELLSLYPEHKTLIEKFT